LCLDCRAADAPDEDEDFARTDLVYAEPFLAPALEPGDVVALDNLADHKVDGVRQAIAAARASILHLPPYSPGLSPGSPAPTTRSGRTGAPVEQLFAKLEALLRKAATGPRTNSGRPSAASSPPRRQANPPTTSDTAAMVLPSSKAL
jgi:hypothetical protein